MNPTQAAGIAVITALLLLAAACSSDGGARPSPSPTTIETPELTVEASDLLEQETLAQSELVLEADFPGAMVFAPDGRLFYNELKAGRVRVVTPQGELLPQPFATVPLAEGDEWGLIGIELDPDFETNGYVYIFYTEPLGDVALPKIVRYTEQDGVGIDAVEIVVFPQTEEGQFPYHVSGNIHFGPDGYLYVTLGNYVNDGWSQDYSNPMGSILRIDVQGDSPPDNPFVGVFDADPRIWAYGIRNSFDFAFNPNGGGLYATENGHTNCDELNLIEPGENYGWPDSFKDPSGDSTRFCENLGFHDAIYYFPQELNGNAFDTTSAPTGIEFASAAAYPVLGDSLLVCEFKTSRMRRYFLQGQDLDIVEEGGVVVEDCQLDIAVAPDGTIYYSNLEQIRRLIPEHSPAE